MVTLSRHPRREELTDFLFKVWFFCFAAATLRHPGDC